MDLLGVLETCLYVDDLSAARSFYEEVLGLPFVSEQPGRHAFFRCGQQMLLLFNPNASCEVEGEIPPHGARGPGHMAFSAPSSEPTSKTATSPTSTATSRLTQTRSPDSYVGSIEDPSMT